MHPSLRKPKIFAGLALLILTLSFTFPMLAFHSVLNKVNDSKGNEVSSLVKQFGIFIIRVDIKV